MTARRSRFWERTPISITQVAAPGTVDQLIDTLQDKYNRPVPGADLLMTNSYDELMQDVYDSKDLGSGVINGVECDTLAFRKNDVDWQIWIAQGDRPYPCQFVSNVQVGEHRPPIHHSIRRLEIRQ